jgi:hypothetical protein
MRIDGGYENLHSSPYMKLPSTTHLRPTKSVKFPAPTLTSEHSELDRHLGSCCQELDRHLGSSRGGERKVRAARCDVTTKDKHAANRVLPVLPQRGRHNLRSDNTNIYPTRGLHPGHHAPFIQCAAHDTNPQTPRHRVTRCLSLPVLRLKSQDLAQVVYGSAMSTTIWLKNKPTSAAVKRHHARKSQLRRSSDNTAMLRQITLLYCPIADNSVNTSLSFKPQLLEESWHTEGRMRLERRRKERVQRRSSYANSLTAPTPTKITTATLISTSELEPQVKEATARWSASGEIKAIHLRYAAQYGRYLESLLSHRNMPQHREEEEVVVVVKEQDKMVVAKTGEVTIHEPAMDWKSAFEAEMAAAGYA